MKIKLPQPEYDVAELEALIAEAKRPQPEIGREYMHVFAKGVGYDGKHFMWMFDNGYWSKRYGVGDPWVSEHAIGRDFWLAGQLVPYTPPPPTFQVGEWVKVIADYSKLKGTRYRVEEYSNGGVSLDGCWFTVSEIRHATPEEIAAATRITPKVGMLLKRKSDGAVLQVFSASCEGAAIRNLAATAPSDDTRYVDGLSTEDYDILPSYTIQGAQ